MKKRNLFRVFLQYGIVSDALYGYFGDKWGYSSEGRKENRYGRNTSGDSFFSDFGKISEGSNSAQAVIARSNFFRKLENQEKYMGIYEGGERGTSGYEKNMESS